MIVRLLRHACAGDRAVWPGADAERPLDELGRAQADALVAALAGTPVGRLRSSPARRCLDTLVPLADARGLVVEEEHALRADADCEDLLALVRSAEPDDVLCTHGEVMRPLLPLLGVKADGEALAKGSLWELEVAGVKVTARRQLLNPAD